MPGLVPVGVVVRCLPGILPGCRLWIWRCRPGAGILSVCCASAAVPERADQKGSHHDTGDDQEERRRAVGREDLRGDHGGRVPRSPAFTARGYSNVANLVKLPRSGTIPGCKPLSGLCPADA